MDMTFSFTERGFSRYDFLDFNGEKCSLQKSSLVATMAADNIEAIWLGCEREKRHPVTEQPLGARMHLSRADVASILPVLLHFVMTGEVSDSPAYVTLPAMPTPQDQGFTCPAKPWADPPQDCNWPMCGCDPKATKVIEALYESGLLQDRAPLSTTERVP